MMYGLFAIEKLDCPKGDYFWVFLLSKFNYTSARDVLSELYQQKTL